MITALGFTASGLIVASVTMRSMRALRLVGLAGSLAFIVYGVALGAWPIVATNLTTTTIHLVHLIRRRLDAGSSPVGPDTTVAVSRPG